MLVTVTGGAGTINWVGETWNLPADSGVQKSVCPTGYSKFRSTYLVAPTTKIYRALHRWNYAGATGLSVGRQYVASYITTAGLWALPPGAGCSNRVQLTNTQTDEKSWYGTQATRFSIAGFPNSNVVNSDINLILGVASPTYNNYDITNDFFGSHTISGITYTWEKGVGW
jgi:hypothetical protein